MGGEKGQVWKGSVMGEGCECRKWDKLQVVETRRNFKESYKLILKKIHMLFLSRLI